MTIKLKTFKILGIVITIIILIIIFMFVRLSIKNSLLSKEWFQKPKNIGQRIEINGHSLYYTLKGKGKPNIIIENGIGALSLEWWSLQDKISKKTSVLTYDRAGYGWSDSGPFPRTSKQIISELSVLLSKLNLTGPYILIGHSIGALYAQHFARSNPKKIAGIIFIDPISLKNKRLKSKINSAIYNNLINKTPGIKVSKFLAQIGLIRYLNAIPYLKVDPEIRTDIVEQYCKPESYTTMISEYQKSLKKSIDQISNSGQFPQIPVIVIHHSTKEYINQLINFGLPYDEAYDIENIYRELNEEIVNLTPFGSLIIANNSIQNMHLNEPEIILEALNKILKKKHYDKKD